MRLLVLDDAAKSVTGVMGDAIVTTAPTFIAVYADSSTSFEELANDGVMNGVTPVTLISGPVNPANRIIRDIIIHNIDSVAHSFSINYVSAGGTRTISKVLNPGDTWTFDGVMDQWGNQKTIINQPTVVSVVNTASLVSVVIPADYSLVVSRKYEVTLGTSIEIGLGGSLEVL
jgi:hypothetical protein